MVTIGTGRSLTLTCIVSKSDSLLSPITITWTTPTGMNYASRVLTVENIQYQDGGIYTCTATTDDVPSDTATNIVYVEGPPSVEIVTSMREAMRNYPFILTCHTNGTHDPGFTWYHNDTRITSHVQHFSNYSVLDISQFAEDNISSYTCIVHDTIHLPVENTIEVVFTKEIYLFNSGDLGNQEVIINSTLVIPCNLIRGEGELNVTWYNGSTHLMNSDRVQISDRTEYNPSTLVIKPAALSDEGQYSCTATDETSHVFNHSFHIIIKLIVSKCTVCIILYVCMYVCMYVCVHVCMYVCMCVLFIFVCSSCHSSGHVPPDVTKEVGSWVELHCVVDGKPKPQVNWTKGLDINLKSNNRRIINHTNGSLIILYVTAEDADTYSCLFKRYTEVNRFETVLKEFKLNVVPQQVEVTTDENEICECLLYMCTYMYIT